MWIGLAEGILEEFAERATGEVRYLEERLSVRARRRFDKVRTPRPALVRPIDMKAIRARTKARRGGRRCSTTT